MVTAQKTNLGDETEVHGAARSRRAMVESAGLIVSDLRKAFRSPTGSLVEVLRGIDFTALPGELIGISGASGSGKSTLLHLVGGLEAPDHGTISRPQSEPSGTRTQNIGFIFQFHHLLPDLTALENVSLPLLIARFSAREARQRARQNLNDLGLGERLHYPVGHLSGGEQQRVAVARALICEPSLVLADEPTGNLDPGIGGEIGEALVTYCHNKRAIVVMVTHNEALMRLCDRSFTLEHGRLRQI